MATTKHARTLALAATSPRVVAVALPTNVTADWTTNVIGTAKPADNATQNRIQTGTSFSGTPVNGDIWIDTNTSPAIVKTRVAGAWVSSANYTTNTNQLADGAGLGTTATWTGVTGVGKPADYADVTTTIMSASGTSIVMNNANLFKSGSGTAGVFIGSGGLFGKNGSGVTTFSIDGATGAATFYGALSGATGTFAGSLSAATGSFAGSLSAATGSFGAVTAGGAVTVNTSGSISNGISYGGTGFFLGYSGAAYKFSVGDATKYLRWDGSTLTFTGALSAATGTFSGTMSAASITSGTLTSASITIPSSAGGNLIDIGYNATVISYRELAGYNITAGNLAAPSNPAVKGTTNYAGEGVFGATSASNSNGTAHALRGYNYYQNSGGLIGAANGWNFYADGAGAMGDYGTFTGGHDALLALHAVVEPGDIVEDVRVIARGGISNVITEITRTTTANSPAAVGVYVGEPCELEDFTPNALYMDPDTYYAVKYTYRYAIMNSLGEGQMNVCGEGGNLLPGDLIVSSSQPGKGMRQADNIVRSVTVAKCREAVTFDHPEQVRLVACIYLCG